MRIVFVSYSYWPPDFGGELLISIERFEMLAKHECGLVALTSRWLALPAQHCHATISSTVACWKRVHREYVKWLDGIPVFGFLKKAAAVCSASIA